MRIVYFYQYFSTSNGSWGTRVYEFSKLWVEKGHDVTVVTSVYSKSDIKANRFIENQIYDGIKVKVININIDNKQFVLRRIYTWLLYMFVSCWYAIRLPADVVIASSGPITVGVPGLIAKYIRGRKLVFEVRDIWPQGAIEMGLLKNTLIIKFAYWFEKCCYNAASHIIALSPGMVDDIIKRFPKKKVTSITNSANITLFSTPSSYNIGDLKYSKYAIYTGNIGKVNNSGWLYNAARILKEKNREDIIILLIGEGQQRESLEKSAKIENITNFKCMSLMPKVNLVAYIQHSMASLVPLKGCPILDSSSPNKFFESLASGIPIIQNTNGWMKYFLNDNQVGFTIDPDDSESLANLLIKMADGEINLREMSIKAKIVSKKEFDKDFLADKMLSILLEENIKK